MKRFLLAIALLLPLTLAACGEIGKMVDASSVTKTEYDMVKAGMSYDEVVAITGFKGEEDGSTQMDAIPGVMGAITASMYSWENSDGSNMVIMFQNGKVQQKSQYGLK